MNVERATPIADAPPRIRPARPPKARMLAAGNTYCRRPVVRMEVRRGAGQPGDLSPDWLRRVVDGLPILRAAVLDFPGWRSVCEARGPIPAVAGIEVLALLLQRSVGWSVSFMAGLVSLRPETSSEELPEVTPEARAVARRVAVFETRQEAVGLLAGRLAADLASRLEQAPEEEVAALLADAFGAFRRRTARETPSRSAIWIADRAERRGISWSALPQNNFLRLGRGRHAEMLRGFDTSLTSCIASNLVKRKDVARSLLAAAGLPVAEQRSARKAETAIAAARAIGHPVVVKPRDGKQGQAVAVNLTTDEEVARAFAQVQAFSTVAVVESLIKGETFRLSVIGGRFFAAAQRHPPRLRGDGARTVEALIAEENGNPERQPGLPVSLKPIGLDEEMLALLAEQGLSPEAVPEAGRWVLLRRVPNPPFGDKTDVTDLVHPTIRAMSERVAAVMGISVCGIDLITTDIARPLEETGGAICEVNTLPDLGVHLLVSEGTPRDGADAVLDMLYPPGKRTSFPLVAVLRDEADERVEDAIRAAWEGRGHKVGVASAWGGADGAAAFEERRRALDMDTELDLGLVVLSPRHLVDWGLGYDAVDLAVAPAGTAGALAKRARRALERVARGRIFALDGPDLAQRSLKALKARGAKAVGRLAEAAPSKTSKAAPAPAAAARRRRPAREDGAKPRGRLRARTPKLMGAGNVHARRPVIEVPIRGGAGLLVPAALAQGLGAILPPLCDQVPDFGGWRRVTTSTEPVPVAAVVEVLAVAAQRYAGWPVRFCAWRRETHPAGPEAAAAAATGSGAAKARTGEDARAVFEVATPVTGAGVAKAALALASALLDGRGPEEMQAAFLEQMGELRQAALDEWPDVDGLEIAREAARRGIAWSVVEGSNFVRLGSGRFAHVLAGSETTKTSRVGQRLARSKRVTSAILATAGLPVPQQRVVRTDEEALDAARTIGFPLVIKPAAGSRGRAVSVGVAAEAGVRPALRRAQAISPEVIVESFIAGDEHRLLVVNGRFAAATRRRPAQVRGDGVSSVRALLERENARPERDRRLSRLSGRALSLVPLALDDEALALLEEQGLTPEAVPAEGRAVLLRRQSNHSCGGDTVDATDAVHPTVRTMAERAAALLGLDVCGIDYITTDVGRPFQETGGAICEVNARPGLRLHYGVAEGRARNVAGDVVEMLFPPGAPSRCPVVVLVGTDAASAGLRRSAEAAAARAGRVLGVVAGPEGAAALAPTTLALKDVGAIAWGKEAEAVLIQASAAEVAERGLGLERIDLAILPAAGGDRTLAAARRALARLAGNRVLQADDPAARRQVLAALGLLAPTRAKRLEARPRPVFAPARAKEPQASPPVPTAALAGAPTGSPMAAVPEAASVLRPKAANATVLMVGDIGFGEPYAHLPRAEGLLRLLHQHGYRHSLANLEGLLSSADLVIGNLETPLSAHPDSALRGRKRNLGWSDPDRTVNALRQAGVHAVSLANNHALDCGAVGLDETLARLKAAGIASFGAGRDLAAADQPLIRRLVAGGQERSLVVFGGFEHRARYRERYRWYARPGAPGVSRLAAERIGSRIAALRETLPAPLFVAYPHWGADYTEVNDAQREEAARLVEAGVDLVVGHGSHGAQAVEMVAGRPVVFGLGNFVWNAPGRYGAFGVRPYSLAASLVFRGGPGAQETFLRLHPIVTDNIVTRFQGRPVTKDEFADAVGVLAGSIAGRIKRRSNRAGTYLELKLDGGSVPRGGGGATRSGQVGEALAAGIPVTADLG